MITVALVGWVLIALAVFLASYFLWIVSERKRQAGAVDEVSAAEHLGRKSVAEHLGGFLLATIAVTLFVIGIILVSGPAFEGLKAGRFLAQKDSLSNDNYIALLALVFGAPIAFGGAVYAIYLALLGLRGSVQHIALADRANMLSDPAYALSLEAHNAYRQYGFLIGSLLASYRLHRHQCELLAYSGQTVGSTNSTIPAMVEILKQLQALLFDRAFSISSLEAARELDVQNGTTKDRHEEHNLRSKFAAMAATLENPQASASDLTRLLAHARLLDDQIRRGLRAVTYPQTARRGTSDAVTHRTTFLGYLRQWMGDIDLVETGQELNRNARVNAFQGEEWITAMTGQEQKTPDAGLTDALNELFSAEDQTKSGPVVVSALGRHNGLSVAALCGDHSTLLGLIESSRAYAKAQNWTPVEVTVNKSLDVQMALPPHNAVDPFHIFICTGRTLPLLFMRDGKQCNLPSNFRGCVIIDGVRTLDLATLEDNIKAVEDDLLEENMARGVQPGDKLHRAPEKMLLTMVRELSGIERPSKATAKVDTGKFVGPQVLWVGIDYREIGQKPPNRLGADHFFEISSILDACNRAISEDVKKLTSL